MMPKTVQDHQRTAYLESLGYFVLRFMNWDVRQNTERVLDHILDVAMARVKAPSPGAARRPLPKGRGEAAASGGRGSKQ